MSHVGPEDITVLLTRSSVLGQVVPSKSQEASLVWAVAEEDTELWGNLLSASDSTKARGLLNEGWQSANITLRSQTNDSTELVVINIGSLVDSQERGPNT